MSEDYIEQIQDDIELALDRLNEGYENEYTLGDEWFFEVKTEFVEEGAYLNIKDLFSVYQLGIYMTGGEDYDAIIDRVVEWITERVADRTPGLIFYEVLWGEEESGEMDLMGPESKHIFFNQETTMEYARKYAEEGEVMVCKNYWVGNGKSYKTMETDFIKCATA